MQMSTFTREVNFQGKTGPFLCSAHSFLMVEASSLLSTIGVFWVVLWMDMFGDVLLLALLCPD